MAEPADALRLTAPGLAISETAVAICVLRVRAADEALTAASVGALAEAFAIAWPTAPNTIAGERPRIAWLAAGEWALFDTGENVAARIAVACQGHLHHLADVSAGRRRWRIEGPQRRDLIAKGCSLDTHRTVFGAGRCAQTLMARVPILLLADQDDRAFDIIADVSLAAHLRAWFADAALEFQP